MGTERVVDHRDRRPSERLASYVTRFAGYRYSGMEPGLHRGMPSCQLTVVISLGPPTRVSEMPDPRQSPADFVTLAGGLHTRPVMIAHDGSQYGIELSLTPAGSRALLGVPSGALGSAVIRLSDLIGGEADEVVERCEALCDWDERFAVVEAVLTRRMDRRRSIPAPLEHAWRRIAGSGGAARVAGVAAEIGWSRRHLSERFLCEFGVTPSEAGRLARFQRSHHLVRRSRGITLAAVAAESGYYDQAHMAREWNDLAGCPPSVWLATEKLPIVQDLLQPAQADWTP